MAHRSPSTTVVLVSETAYALASDDLAVRVLDGEALVLDFATGYYFGLNGTGTALWQLLETAPRSASVLISAVATGYSLDADEVAPDVAHFLDGLVDGALVVTVDQDGSTVAPIAVDGPYLAPVVERYEKLDDLILSGE